MARVTLMTDASLCGDTGAGGFGYWAVSERGGTPGGGQFRDVTKDSFAAELKGVVNSLAAAIKCKAIQPGDNILIQLDNMGVIQCIEGKPTSREDIIPILDIYKCIVKTHNLHVWLRHVKGHSKSKSNRSIANKMCDLRAKEHMREHRKKLKEQPYD